MVNFTESESKALIKLIHTDEVQFEMGAENWDLTEDEELTIWALIKRSKSCRMCDPFEPSLFNLSRIHYLRMRALWGEKWAVQNAFTGGRWPQSEADWRKTPHGAPWDNNVEMAKFHLQLAKEIANG